MESTFAIKGGCVIFPEIAKFVKFLRKFDRLDRVGHKTKIILNTFNVHDNGNYFPDEDFDFDFLGMVNE
jgi:hypothetical protein